MRTTKLMVELYEANNEFKVTFTYPGGKTSTVYCRDGADVDAVVAANSDLGREVTQTAFGRAEEARRVAA